MEWPSGKVEEFSNIATNQFLTVTETPLTLVNRQLTLPPGAAGAFEVVAHPPNATYQWRFNGVDLTGQTNRILAFPNASIGQAGAYTVRVTDNRQWSNFPPP